jgi:hypothetical protein
MLVQAKLGHFANLSAYNEQDGDASEGPARVGSRSRKCHTVELSEGGLGQGRDFFVRSNSTCLWDISCVSFCRSATLTGTTTRRRERNPIIHVSSALHTFCTDGSCIGTSLREVIGLRVVPAGPKTWDFLLPLGKAAKPSLVLDQSDPQHVPRPPS